MVSGPPQTVRGSQIFSALRAQLSAVQYSTSYKLLVAAETQSIRGLVPIYVPVSTRETTSVCWAICVWGGEGLAAALGDVGRWRGRTPGTECVQGRPERGTSVSGVVLASLERY